MGDSRFRIGISPPIGSENFNPGTDKTAGSITAVGARGALHGSITVD